MGKSLTVIGYCRTGDDAGLIRGGRVGPDERENAPFHKGFIVPT